MALAAAAVVVVPTGVASAAAACDPASFHANSGDEISDTAVGTPQENVGKVSNAGSVTVVYGSESGFGNSGSMLLTQESFGGKSESNDRFGAALTIGDVNNDGCKDLIIGVPGENNGAGRIQIVFGSPSGLSLTGAQNISQDTKGAPGTSEKGDAFGSAVAVQGTGGGAHLWVGAPGENIGKIKGAGTLMRFDAGSGGKLSPSSGKGYGQGSNGTPGSPETGDRFGTTLSGTAYSLVVGVPREDIGTIKDAGQIFVYTDKWTSVQQDTKSPVNVKGSSEKGDRFGASVAQVPSCDGNPAHEAYVVGVPSENVGKVADAGTVTVVDLYAGSGLILTQGSGPLASSSAESGDNFGLRVAAAGHLLAAAAPLEDLGNVENAGNVTQVVLGCSGSTPTVTQATSLSLDTADVPTNASKGDRFGLELAFDWIHEGAAGGPSLVVGAPLKADGSILDSGRAYSFVTKSGDVFTGAGSINFGQSTPGIAGAPEKADQFGLAIATNAS